MKELFETISSYINKIVTYVDTMFDSVQQGIEEINTWVSYLPAGLIASAAIIIVLLVVFRVLGR